MSNIVLKEKMTFDKFSNDLKNKGFRVDGDIYRIEKDIEDKSTQMIVNGQRVPQYKHIVFTMRYIGEGGELDSGSEEEIKYPMYFFEILGENGNPEITMSFFDIDDFNKTIDI